jgi:hypothetical protein
VPAMDDPRWQREAVEASDPGLFGAHRGWVGHVGHQRIGRNLTEQTGLEVLQGLPQFASSVHHKGPICRDRFANGLATQDKQLQGRTLRVLVVITADLEPVAAAEHHQLTVTGWCPFGTHAPSASKNVDERIKGWIPPQLQSRARRNGRMNQRDGRVCVDPGPRWPPTSPAITRTNALASADSASFTAAASMPW